MKKLIFALFVLTTSIASYAQGESAKTQVSHSDNSTPESKAQHLKERIMRVTNTTDKGTSLELYNTSLTFFKAREVAKDLSIKDMASAKKMFENAKAKREINFQKILGNERYAKLEAARKLNKEKKAKADSSIFIDEAIEE